MADNRLHVEAEETENSITITPYGKIDTLTSESFYNAVEPYLQKDKELTFDLGECLYISSSGLRAFMNIRKVADADKAIRMINVDPVIMDVFELTGFDELFDIHNNDTTKLDIKVAFFDIDGTLLSHKTNRVPDSTKEAIKKLQAKGIECVIATGRDLIEMRKLPINDISFDAYLTLNGNICLDKNEKMFAGNEIDPGEVEVLVSIFKAGKIPFVLIGENKRYLNYVDETVIKTQLATNGTIPNIGEYNGEKIYQCLAFVDGDIRNKLETMLDNCKITSWNETGLDIIAKTGGKDAGIRKYLDYKGFKRSEAMAFGDGENDATMLGYVGTGVAMGNGNEQLKKIADYVTADIDDDGIMKALQHFELID